jgi:hypothetical protein
VASLFLCGFQMLVWNSVWNVCLKRVLNVFVNGIFNVFLDGVFNEVLIGFQWGFNEVASLAV